MTSIRTSTTTNVEYDLGDDGPAQEPNLLRTSPTAVRTSRAQAAVEQALMRRGAARQQGSPVSSSVPEPLRLSETELERVEAFNDETNDPMAIRGGDLTRRTQLFMLDERHRTEVEKYDFSMEDRMYERDLAPEAEKKRDESNAKRQEKLEELTNKRAEVSADPKMKPEKKEKKLKKLDEKIAKEEARIRPEFSLENMTAAIFNDPTLSGKDKKKKIDLIRKDYGLKKRGHMSFRDLVTGRLGDIYDDSKKRVDEQRREVKEGSKARLKELEKAYGKDSAEVKTFKADLKAAQKAGKLESRQLGAKAKLMKSMYPSFLKRLLSSFAKAAIWLSIPAAFIPGVGPAVAAGILAAGAGAGFAAGDWKLGVANIVSMVPVPGAGALASKLGVTAATKSAGSAITRQGTRMAAKGGVGGAAGKAMTGAGEKIAERGGQELVQGWGKFGARVTWDASMRGEVMGVSVEEQNQKGLQAKEAASPVAGSSSFSSLRDEGLA